MRLFLVSLFLLLTFEVLAQTSYVAPARILHKKGYQLTTSGDYFQSSTRIDQNKEEDDFLDGESFKRTQVEFQGLYGLSENLQIGGGLRFRQNDSTVLNTTTNEEETETSSGVESTFLSLIYAFRPVDNIQYSLEGLYRFRPFTNEESDGASQASLVLGDDGNEYSAGLAVTYSSMTKNFLSARAGYRNPGQDLSTEIYWQVEGALTWKYVALLAGVDGISSLKNDPYEDDSASKPNLNTGSTALYNSTNRELIAPYAGINFALGPSWRVEFKGSQIVSGQSTDLGTNVGVSIIRRVEESKSTTIDRKFKEYDFEASVTKVSPKKGYLVIDKGLSADIQKGMKIDFFEFDYVGGNILLATGTVIQVKTDSAIVKITQLYNTKKELKEGLVARGSFR